MLVDYKLRIKEYETKVQNLEATIFELNGELERA